MRDPVGNLDVLGDVAIDDDQIRELAGLQTAEIPIETQVFRRGDGRGTECFQRRHAALHEHPQLPVGGEPFALTVGARVHQHPGVGELLGDGRVGG